MTNFKRITANPEALAEKLVSASYYQESAFSRPSYCVNGTEYGDREKAICEMVNWLNDLE